MYDMSLAASLKQANDADIDPNKLGSFYAKQFPAIFDR